MRLLLGILCIVFPLAQSHAQELPVTLNVDHAVFAYSEDASLLELYLAVEAATLDFERDSAGFRAELPLDIALRRSATAALQGVSDQVAWADSIVLNFSLPDTTNLSEGQHFIHQLRTAVPPGEYELSLSVPASAAHGRQLLELRRDILVPELGDDGRVALSDVTLASEIQPGNDRTNPFFKNGLVIRPNANLLFGQGLDQLYYYAEAYGVNELAGSDGNYTVYTYVSEANRPQPVADLSRRLDREARTPDVLVGQFDVGALPSGSYFLRLAVLNEENEAVVEQARKFFVYNPGVERERPPAVDIDFEASQYATMTQEDVEQSFEHIAIIANESEQRRMRRLADLEARQRFLKEFWDKRDDNPATTINEFRDEFYRRLQYVNDRYSSNRQPGWKTDRGRTVIRYGMPANIEPHLYDRDAAPHEIWQYNSIPGEGQAIFVFADLNGFGLFELIHSSVAGERSIPNWEAELRR